MTKKILVFTKEGSDCSSFEELYKNHTVEYCYSMENGVEQLQQNNFDVVIFDCPEVSHRYIECLTERVSLRKQLQEAIFAYERAIRTSNIKDKATKIIAHETNGSMNTVLLSSALGAEISTGQVHDLFKQINNSGRRTTDICSRYLREAESDEEIPYHFSSQRLSGIITRVLVSQLPLVKKKKINISFPPPFFDDHLLVDEIAISQVIQNIILNAIKFTPDYGNIKTKIEETPEEYISVSISDSGVGIPKSKLNNLFHFLGKGDPPPETHEGFGLGLSISKEIISKHNGRIWAENLQEGGAKFTFSLPRNQVTV